jgi:tRNA (guanine37-N1)-methyltransferase
MALVLHIHVHVHPHRLLRRSSSARFTLGLKPLSSSSSSSPVQTPHPLHGPSLRRGRAPPDHSDPFARAFDLAALCVPAAACAPLERRLRGHLLNWPRVRNVARLPNDQGLALALALSLPSPARGGPAAKEGGPALLTAVARREKLGRDFNARGFVRFPNLARLSRPAARKRNGKKGGDSDEEATRALDKDRAYVVEVVGEGGEDDADEWNGLVGEGFGKGACRMGPTRLLLLDERYADRRVNELPEAVKVMILISFLRAFNIALIMIVLSPRRSSLFAGCVRP